MKRVIAVIVTGVMLLTGCEDEKIIEPCKRDGTGILKLNNKTALRFTAKIDGISYGQIERNDVREYVVRHGNKYVCIELSNAICYKDFAIDIIPCEITTKELNY